jgi:hypothetical protein
MDIYSSTTTKREIRNHMMPSISTDSNDSFYENENDNDDDVMVSFAKNSIYSYSTDPTFQKYIGKHKYYAFFLLRIFNPFKKIMFIENTLSNILNVFILQPKREEEKQKQNTIYIFYNNSNLVTKIKYIGIYDLDDNENHSQFIYTDNQQLLHKV